MESKMKTIYSPNSDKVTVYDRPLRKAKWYNGQNSVNITKMSILVLIERYINYDLLKCTVENKYACLRD